MRKDIEYVYQISLRYPNDDKKRFNIESDTVLVKRKFTKKDIKEMSENLKADVRVLYLGVLTPPSNKKEFSHEELYNTEEIITDYLNKWKGLTKNEREQETKSEDIQ